MLSSMRYLICLLVLCGTSLPALAQVSDAELYKAETIVTGTVEPERSRGFAAGALQVLIKLTGQPDLVGAPGAAGLQKQAPEMVATFSYEDRMKDIPVHDEQGTRERPHYLRIRFDRQKFDRALAEAGFEKWVGKRPTVAIWLSIRAARSTYTLSRDGEGGYAQRLVLDEASKLREIPIILPDEAQAANFSVDNEVTDIRAINAYFFNHGADAVLHGALIFDGTSYWNCFWSLHGKDIWRQWRLKGVTFDSALKNGIDQVMIAYAEKARQEK